MYDQDPHFSLKSFLSHPLSDGSHFAVNDSIRKVLYHGDKGDTFDRSSISSYELQSSKMTGEALEGGDESLLLLPPCAFYQLMHENYNYFQDHQAPHVFLTSDIGGTHWLIKTTKHRATWNVSGWPIQYTYELDKKTCLYFPSLRSFSLS